MSTNYFRKDSPKLDGTNYGIWKIRMETHLNCIGKDIWEVTKNGYTVAVAGQTAPITLAKDEENDCKAREALLSALSDQQIMGLSDRSTAKAIWDTDGSHIDYSWMVKSNENVLHKIASSYVGFSIGVMLICFYKNLASPSNDVFVYISA